MNCTVSDTQLYEIHLTLPPHGTEVVLPPQLEIKVMGESQPLVASSFSLCLWGFCACVNVCACIEDILINVFAVYLSMCLEGELHCGDWVSLSSIIIIGINNSSALMSSVPLFLY